jgi:hypothetical protein
MVEADPRSMIEIAKTEIERAAALKLDPDGYRSAIAKVGEDRGDTIALRSEDYHSLRARFPAVSLPSKSDLVRNFSAAVGRWLKAGFPVVSGDLYRARLSTCRTCPHWDGKAFAGSGKCRLCGCAKSKLWLATEACPDGRWPSRD